MRAYVIKRLLLMIPTFMGITLLVFAVLNFAPGKPGALQQAGTDQATDARGADTQESQRIFREQFGLDKPVLFNTLTSLERPEVEKTLRAAIGEGDATLAERIAAQERLDAWGSYAVPALVAVLGDAQRSGESALRAATLRALRAAARRPLVDPFADDPTPEQRERNRQIDVENARLRALRFEAGDDEARRAEVVAEWLAWYDANRERWEWSRAERVRILFLETRFARYFTNLVRLDFGVSLVTREPVLETLLSKLPYSLTLSVGSLLLAYLIAIPLGVFSAVSRDTRADRSTTVLLFMLYSLPSFFVATLLLYFFSAASDYPALRWFPTGALPVERAARADESRSASRHRLASRAAAHVHDLRIPSPRCRATCGRGCST